MSAIDVRFSGLGCVCVRIGLGFAGGGGVSVTVCLEPYITIHMAHVAFIHAFINIAANLRKLFGTSYMRHMEACNVLGFLC